MKKQTKEASTPKEKSTQNKGTAKAGTKSITEGKTLREIFSIYVRNQTEQTLSQRELLEVENTLLKEENSEETDYYFAIAKGLSTQQLRLNALHQYIEARTIEASGNKVKIMYLLFFEYMRLEKENLLNLLKEIQECPEALQVAKDILKNNQLREPTEKEKQTINLESVKEQANLFWANIREATKAYKYAKSVILNVEREIEERNIKDLAPLALFQMIDCLKKGYKLDETDINPPAKKENKTEEDLNKLEQLKKYIANYEELSSILDKINYEKFPTYSDIEVSKELLEQNSNIFN